MVVLLGCWVLFVLWLKFWEKIKLTEYDVSHKGIIKKKTLHYHFQGAKLKTSLDYHKKVVSKWVIRKHFFGGGGYEEREWD